jgi:hypothetical protein
MIKCEWKWVDDPAAELETEAEIRASDLSVGEKIRRLEQLYRTEILAHAAARGMRTATLRMELPRRE